MSISDEDLARKLFEDDGKHQWGPHLAPIVCMRWRGVAAKARELLTPDMQIPPFPGSLGPLQSGDVVSVRGVVKMTARDSMVQVELAGNFGTRLRVGAEWLTLIGRPAPPEPDWAPGDVAKSESDTLYAYRWDGMWVDCAAGVAVKRSEIPGTLTPCDVVPREPK